MKNSTFIKILLSMYILVGIIGFTSYLLPDSATSSSTFYDVSKFQIRKKNTITKQEAANEEETSENNDTINDFEFNDDENLFVMDVWLDNINDFSQKVNEALTKEQEESKEDSELDDSNNITDELFKASN